MARLICVAARVVVLMGVLFYPNPVRASRMIPDDNLAYPVLITFQNSATRMTEYASGFYLRDDTYFYLVTATHVLFDQIKQKELNSAKEETVFVLKAQKLQTLSYLRNPKAPGRAKLSLDIGELDRLKKIKRHNTHDVTVVRLGTINLVSGEVAVNFESNAVTIEEWATPGPVVVAPSTVKKFDDVLTSNDIYIFGYPRSLGIPEIPQIDYEVPLLRKGILAGKNNKQKFLIIDCPIYPGNSGGPVMEVEVLSPGSFSYRIIGVVTQFVPFAEIWENKTQKYSNVQLSNSGYGVAVPMDMVLELLKD